MVKVYVFLKVKNIVILGITSRQKSDQSLGFNFLVQDIIQQ
jgi:hypothetical protein